MPVRRHPVAVTSIRDPLAIVPLDLALVQRLKATYSVIRARDTRLAESFYRRLFDAAPHLRPMFKSAPADQARKLTDALDAVVRNLEEPTQNASMLDALGRRHADYGARPEHYDLVITLLIESMREVLGDESQVHALEEWHMALRLISDQMIRAAATNGPSVADPSSSLRD
jgi:hemoglobin-like flavoprotein